VPTFFGFRRGCIPAALRSVPVPLRGSSADASTAINNLLGGSSPIGGAFACLAALQGGQAGERTSVTADDQISAAIQRRCTERNSNRLLAAE